MSKHYRTISEVMDYGPQITKVILDKGKRMDSDPSPEDFKVHVERKLITEDIPWPAFMGEHPKFPMSGERRVEAAYRSDKDGVKNTEGTFVTLQMHCDPRDGLGSTIRFNGKYNENRLDYDGTEVTENGKAATICEWLAGKRRA